MYEDKTFLAIIPARGGSKRLPRKNVLDLAGKPLIAWTVEAALKSQYIDKVIVSSDDEEILKVARQYGADTIIRPDELASDTATTFDAVKHAINNCEQYDYIILLQATSPLRDSQHIDEAIELLEHKKADAIVSVCEMEHSPLWSNTLPEDGSMAYFLREDVKNKRSQDLERYYRLNGAIYISQNKALLKSNTFLIENNIYAFEMKGIFSIDIDETEDFLLAEILLKGRMYD